MRLTLQDKNAILKATLKANDPSHFESFKQWVVSLVEAADNAEATEGRADTSVTVPPYVPHATGYVAVRTAPQPTGQEWTHDYLTSNGASRG